MTPDRAVQAVNVTAGRPLASALVWNTVRQTNSDFKLLKKVSTTELS